MDSRAGLRRELNLIMLIITIFSIKINRRGSKWLLYSPSTGEFIDQ